MAEVVMDDEDLSLENVFNLPASIENDFRSRAEAMRDFARLNPEATFEELGAYQEKIRPSDPVKAEVYAKWNVLVWQKEFDNE